MHSKLIPIAQAPRTHFCEVHAEARYTTILSFGRGLIPPENQHFWVDFASFQESITLPPINMEPDRGSWKTIFLLKGPPVRFHVSWWEGIHPGEFAQHVMCVTKDQQSPQLPVHHQRRQRRLTEASGGSASRGSVGHDVKGHQTSGEPR